MRRREGRLERFTALVGSRVIGGPGRAVTLGVGAGVVVGIAVAVESDEIEGVPVSCAVGVPPASAPGLGTTLNASDHVRPARSTAIRRARRSNMESPNAAVREGDQGSPGATGQCQNR